MAEVSSVVAGIWPGVCDLGGETGHQRLDWRNQVGIRQYSRTVGGFQPIEFVVSRGVVGYQGIRGIGGQS